MDSHFIFFSKNNYNLGERLRSSLKKFNFDIMYCNDLSNLFCKLSSQKNNVVFLDKVFNSYANLVSLLSQIEVSPITNTRFVFIDDDFKNYATISSSERFYVIPETNLESALYNIVTKCQMLNYAQENKNVVASKYGEIVSEELRKLGFSYKLVGFRYIKQCMEQAIKNNFTLASLHEFNIPNFIAFPASIEDRLPFKESIEITIFMFYRLLLDIIISNILCNLYGLCNK
jgi:hypothetical protein